MSSSASSVVTEMFSRTGSFRTIRVGPSSATVAVVCVIALAFFSVVDFREIGLIRKQQDISEQNAVLKKQQEEFSAWLGQKEEDLNRFLLVTGEESVDNAVPAPKETVGTINELQEKLERIESKFQQLAEFQAGEEDTFWYVPTISPVALSEKFMIASAPLVAEGAKVGLSGLSSTYGMRIHPIKKVEQMHYGVDIFCPQGTEVKATANGQVLFSESYKADEDNLRHSFGQFVLIRHGDSGIETLYAHLSRVLVVKGQLVKRGDPIGYTGQTGISTAPHLHYEVVRNGIKVDPLNYIHDVPLVERGKKVFYARTDKVTKRARARSRS